MPGRRDFPNRANTATACYCDKEFSSPFYLPRALTAIDRDKSQHYSFGPLTKIVEQRHCKRNANLSQ